MSASAFKKLNNNSKFIPEGVPFTQISNEVICHIKNGDAFLVYSYLFSKSVCWKVVKQNIKNQYGFGDGKIKKIFSYLARANLVKPVQEKGEKGWFEKADIMVLNGSEFDRNVPYKAVKAPKVANIDQDLYQKSGGTEIRPADNRSSGFGGLLNKEDTKQRKERSVFEPNAENQKLCQDHGINIGIELNSFKNIHKGKKTQMAFCVWVHRAIEHYEKRHKKPEVKSTVPDYKSEKDHKKYTSNKENVDAALLMLPESVRPKRLRGIETLQ